MNEVRKSRLCRRPEVQIARVQMHILPAIIICYSLLYKVLDSQVSEVHIRANQLLNYPGSFRTDNTVLHSNKNIISITITLV